MDLIYVCVTQAIVLIRQIGIDVFRKRVTLSVTMTLGHVMVGVASTVNAAWIMITRTVLTVQDVSVSQDTRVCGVNMISTNVPPTHLFNTSVISGAKIHLDLMNAAVIRGTFYNRTNVPV